MTVRYERVEPCPRGFYAEEHRAPCADGGETRTILEPTEILGFDRMTWAVREHLEMWADVIESGGEPAGHVRIVLNWVDQMRGQLKFSPNGFGPAALLVLPGDETHADHYGPTGALGR